MPQALAAIPILGPLLTTAGPTLLGEAGLAAAGTAGATAAGTSMAPWVLPAVMGLGSIGGTIYQQQQAQQAAGKAAEKTAASQAEATRQSEAARILAIQQSQAQGATEYQQNIAAQAEATRQAEARQAQAYQTQMSAQTQATLEAQARSDAAQKAALETWQKTAYPTEAAIKASAIENRGTLGQARLGSYQNLASNLAARGFGAGSGLMGIGAGGIEKGYLQGLGKMSTELTKFAQTPMFGPPSQAYPTALGYLSPPSPGTLGYVPPVNYPSLGQNYISPPNYPSMTYPPVSGAVQAGLGKGTDIMDTAMGYYLMSSLLKSFKS